MIEPVLVCLSLLAAPLPMAVNTNAFLHSPHQVKAVSYGCLMYRWAFVEYVEIRLPAFNPIRWLIVTEAPVIFQMVSDKFIGVLCYISVQSLAHATTPQSKAD